MRKERQGFTLIELMITISLAAIILTLGVPSFQSVMERSQLTTSINQFVSSLALARSEAIKRKQRVVVCASSDGETCAGNTGYENGWIVYEESLAPDNNRDTNNEPLIWVGENLAVNMTLSDNAASPGSIEYRPNGRANGNRSVVLCKDDQLNKARMITIISTGRVHLAQTNNQGIPIKSNGDPIESCT